MNISRISAVFIRQLFLIKGNPVRIINMFLWIILDIIQWGFITKYLGSFGNATFNFVTVILGSIILWGFMTRIQQGIMMAFLEDIWTPNLINFFSSPIKVSEYLAGLILTSIATGLVGFILMIVIAGVGFGYNLFIMGWLLLPFLMILFVSAMVIGIVITAMIFRLGPTAEWLGWPIPFFLSVFSGVFYPVSTLPASLQSVAAIIPPAYVFESMREIMSTGVFSSGSAYNLLIGFILSLAYLVVAYLFFVYIYRKNLKSGKIARFNAET